VKFFLAGFFYSHDQRVGAKPRRGAFHDRAIRRNDSHRPVRLSRSPQLAPSCLETGKEYLFRSATVSYGSLRKLPRCDWIANSNLNTTVAPITFGDAVVVCDLP
jgi:hypothetical protein